MAKKKKRSILHDERWQKMALRYRNDRVGFCVEVMGHKPSKQQRQVLRAMDRQGARVSVRSGHGTGKSYLAGDLVCHHMLCHVKPEITLTANNIDQVRKVVFKYVTEAWETICQRHPWLRQYFTVTSEAFFCKQYKKSWFTEAKTVPKDRPEGIAGRHNKNLMFLVDEAAGVPDEVLGVIKGALSEDNNRLLMFSQPTRNSGEFYDSHHSLKKMNPDDPDEPGYVGIHLDSEESPHVTIKAIREYIKTYGGTDTPEYQIKVKGNFSDQLEGFLISRRACDAGVENIVNHTTESGVVIIADVGGGVERDSSVVGAFNVSGYDDERCLDPIEIEERPKTEDAVEFAHHIWQMIQRYEGCSVAVDSVGIGATTAKELEKKGVSVQRIMWGTPCHAEAHQERFLNQRAYCYVALRDGLNESRVRFDAGKQIIEQASRIPYRLNEHGKYVMKKKEEMRAEGIPSPDWADVYAMGMMVDYIPDYSQSASDEEDEYLQQMLAVANG